MNLLLAFGLVTVVAAFGGLTVLFLDARAKRWVRPARTTR